MRILTIAFALIVGILIMLLNSSFGNYTETIYDLFINPFLFIIYITLSIIIYFKSSFKIEYYYLLLIPIIFTFISLVWKKSLHKNVTLSGIIENSKSSTIKLFDNNSFEIKIQHQHGADFKKGDYEIEKNQIILKIKNIEELTDSLFTRKYKIIENKKLEPIDNQKFKTITVYNNGYN